MDELERLAVRLIRHLNVLRPAIIDREIASERKALAGAYDIAGMLTDIAERAAPLTVATPLSDSNPESINAVGGTKGRLVRLCSVVEGRAFDLLNLSRELAAAASTCRTGEDLDD